ncbi:hypothetical protein [Acinetobacter silvestris]|uniref:Uncharacterized protein n=1 Tax=Acinetobacter silvestris TaxID=1977882 RepID=A0A1Y3CD84_9GAMM|nr:hypothetical protein [Acinetobacter silvestris]OTG65058.1 hypothetical protein B9T28_09700 [Acinetobacter silvestris]
MILSNQKHVVEQVYYYLIERPEYRELSQHEKLKAFLDVMKDKDSERIVMENHSTYIGSFGGIVRKINGMKAPEFTNKDDFLAWALGQVN